MAKHKSNESIYLNKQLALLLMALIGGGNGNFHSGKMQSTFQVNAQVTGQENKGLWTYLALHQDPALAQNSADVQIPTVVQSSAVVPNPALDLQSALPRLAALRLPSLPTLRVSIRLQAITDFIFDLIGHVFMMLKTPIALLIVAAVVWYTYNVAYMSVISMLCKIPRPFNIAICPIQHNTSYLSTSVQPNQATINVLNYTSKLEELQKLGAIHAVLPYQLQVGEQIARRMIAEVSALDLPSSKELQPLLDKYSKYADVVVDGLTEWLVMVDSVVDRTIVMNQYTANELLRIDDDAGFPAKIDRVMRYILNKPFDCSREAALEIAFADFSDRISDDLAEGLSGAVTLHHNLVEMRNLLHTIGLAIKTDQRALGNGKTGGSIWQNLFSSHRDKMKDYDLRIRKCEEFSEHTDISIMVVAITISNYKMLRADVRNLSAAIQRGRVVAENSNGNTLPLRLHIHSLQKSIESLEATREATKAVKHEKIKQHQNVILTLPAGKRSKEL